MASWRFTSATAAPAGRGSVVAGACFILPAFCIVLAVAWSYAKFGKLPEATGILYGGNGGASPESRR